MFISVVSRGICKDLFPRMPKLIILVALMDVLLRYMNIEVRSYKFLTIKICPHVSVMAVKLHRTIDSCNKERTKVQRSVVARSMTEDHAELPC